MEGLGEQCDGAVHIGIPSLPLTDYTPCALVSPSVK